MASSVANNDRAQLLVSLPEYGIIICKQCAFAVQPNALPGHLLRHQIYRNERRELLKRFSTVPLNEPDDVPTPPPDSEPVEYLPVYTGLICNAENCGYACVSQKRMNQHWSELHGESNSQAVDARTARIQTFFRGNKLKYFEVTGGNLDDTHEEPDGDNSFQQSPFLPGLEESDSLINTNDISMEIQHDAAESMADEPETGLDMNSLRYLHHYSTETGRTLSRDQDSQHFWTHNVVLEAFSHEYLMQGLLGFAALHLASMCTDSESKKGYLQAGMSYQVTGLKGFRAAIGNLQEASSMALVCFSRVVGAQRIVQWQISDGTPCEKTGLFAESPSAPMIEFMLLLRGHCEVAIKLQDRLPSELDSPLQSEALPGTQPLTNDQLITEGQHPFLISAVIHHLEISMAKDFEGQPYVPKLADLIEDRDLAKLCSEALTLASEQQITVEWIQAILPHWKIYGTKGIRIVDAFHSSVISAKMAFDEAEMSGALPPLPPRSRFPNITLEEYDHLIQIPIQMRVNLKPEDSLAVPAVMPELVAILHSYSRANASDGTAAAWNGVECWASAISKRFVNLVEEISPAAMIVFAYWAAMMRRLQDYWYVAGQPARLIELVRANLPEEALEIIKTL